MRNVYFVRVKSYFILCWQVQTCPPAMGDSFAAGTTDGPGAFNFKQGIYFLSVH